MIMKKQSEYISGLCTLMTAALFCFIMAGCANNEVDFPDKVDKVKITSIVVNSNVEDLEGTRSNNHTWENGDELYIKLNDGAGFATYHDGIWEFAQLEGEENLGTYTDYSCYVKFFKGDYERIQDENGKYFVKPGNDCIVYSSYTGSGSYTNTGKYTLTSDGKLIVSATLTSELNRVRMCSDKDYLYMDLRIGCWRKELIEMFDPDFIYDSTDYSIKSLDYTLADDGKYYTEYVYYYKSVSNVLIKVSDLDYVYARLYYPERGGSLTINLPSESSYDGWVRERYENKLVKVTNLPIISGSATCQEELSTAIGASLDGILNYELIDTGQSGRLSFLVTGGSQNSIGNSFNNLTDYKGKLEFYCMSMPSSYYFGTVYPYKATFSGSNILIDNGDNHVYLSNF